MRVRRDRSIQVAATLAGCLVLALLGASSAFAAEPPPYFSSFGPDGTASTGFGQAGPIAIDQQAHLVYVIDHSAGSLRKFDTEGHPVDFSGSGSNVSGNEINGLSLFSCPGCSQVAVDPVSHDIYVTSENSIKAFHANGEAAEFTAGPGSGTNSIGGFGELLGVAVDANGDIYAADYASGVEIFGHAGESITQFSAPEAGNIAVDGNGAVYVNRWSATVLKFSPTEFPVTSTTAYAAAAQPLDPAPSRTVAVDPATNDVYVDRSFLQPGIVWYDENGNLIATFARTGEEGALVSSEGIAISGDEKRVFVSNVPESGLSQVEIFWEEVYEGEPRIEATSSMDVTGDSAILRASINPGSAATTYYFEYGLEDCAVSICMSAPATPVDIGGGHKVIGVAQSLAGLQANTIYHYRVVAKNEVGDNLANEEDHIFITQPRGLGFQLSDSRAWEMVSPPEKHGALLDSSLNAQVQAAADGDGLTYPSRGSIEIDPEGSRAVEASTVLSRRAGDGWRSKDITLPHDRVTELPVGREGEYKLFGPDLTLALVEPRTSNPLSADASEKTPYLRENTASPAYTPLVTDSNVFPPDTQFGGDPASPIGAVGVEGASEDLSHVVLSSEVPLVPEAPPAPARSLYLWAAGQLQRVSVLPGAEGGTMVDTRILGSAEGSVRHAVSDDGSRVFWSAGGPSALYLRSMKDPETVRLDVVQPGVTGTGTPSPIFQGANTDGTAAFFTDSQRLTNDASSNGVDLYRCEIPAASPPAGCSSLVDISAPMGGSGEDTEVLGIASGLGDEGTRIYFVAKGVLDAAANEAGQTAVAAKPNLYLWRQGQGVRFIATLSEQDQNDWGVQGVTYHLSAIASPSGRYLSFMSLRSLTGKDNLDAESGEPIEQVFRYDADSERLDCLSCNPTGAAPDGELVTHSLRLVDPRSQWEGERVAAILPEPTTFEVAGVSLYTPRAVLDNGRVFFNAIDSLVSADSNGQWDIYQYEPVGAGNCDGSSSDAATSKTAGGCVSLLSSGTGEAEAGFLDASETGDDVFFLTPARLNAPDEDSELDVYDARVNGIPAVLPRRAECLGEACQPPPVAPNDPTPASAAFKGPGNLKQRSPNCRKSEHRVRRRGESVCVKRKPKKHQQRGGNSGRVRR